MIDITTLITWFIDKFSKSKESLFNDILEAGIYIGCYYPDGKRKAVPEDFRSRLLSDKDKAIEIIFNSCNGEIIENTGHKERALKCIKNIEKFRKYSKQ